MTTRRLTIAALAVLAVVALAFLAELAVERWGTDRYAYRVEVVRDSAVLGSFDVDELRSLGTRVMRDEDDKVQEGPTLLSVLKAVGVEDFDRVEIVGLGLRDSGHLTLGHGDIDRDVLLDFNERGTVKVWSPDIEYEARVRDVTRVVVR